MRKRLLIMFNQVFALYSSIKAHYKYGINETSLNVVFRSLFESCLNNAYLFLDDGTDYSKKLESYVYWACTKQKKILNDNKKNTVAESLERHELNKKITFLNTLINSDKYEEIKAKEGIENWYGYDSEINSIYKLSKYVEWDFIYDHAYSYLSTSAHGTKMKFK